MYECDRDKWRREVHSEKTVNALSDIEDDQCVVDMFSQEYGATVRSCFSCGVLIIGGASRCGFCAFRYGARHQEGWWDPAWKIAKRIANLMHKLGRWMPDSR